MHWLSACVDYSERTSSISEWNLRAPEFAEAVAPWLYQGTVAAAIISLSPADVNVPFGVLGYELSLRKTTSTLLAARVERLYFVLPPLVGLDEAWRVKLKELRRVTLRLIREDERMVLGFDLQRRLGASDYAAGSPARPNQKGREKLTAGLWAAMCDQFESCP